MLRERRKAFVRGILFDFDDTLVETTVHFNRAKGRFARIMAGLGFPVEEALATLNKNDIKNVRKFGGFLQQCFPRAMGETYEYYCRAFGREYSRTMRKEIEDIGWWVFEQPVRPIAGAEDVLRRLYGKFPLFLATKGEQPAQEARLRESGLSRWFDRVYVLVDKNTTVYHQIALEQKIRPPVSWMVGNSMKSDINPALQAGFRCIYVHHPHTWDYEDEEPMGGHIRVESISDVAEVVLESDAAYA